jgi:hypothetical protein
VRFTLNGQQFELTAKDVQDRLRAVSPEPVQEYGVQIGLVRYPVKQALEAATGVSRRKFTTQVARRQLAALDFEIVATIGSAGLRFLPKGTPKLVSRSPRPRWPNRLRVIATGIPRPGCRRWLSLI